MNKEKFNPDINDKIKSKEYERNSTKYNLNTTIYNPITGIVPQNITSNKDLKLNIDTPQIEIKKLIQDKERERMEQDATYKPQQTKIINNNDINDVNCIKMNPNSENNKYNILNSLKNLGILNK
jgi:hypothetical protein